MNPDNPFKWRHFKKEIILLTVRWYLRYALSYRDLEEMMQERRLSIDHTTIYQIHCVIDIFFQESKIRLDYQLIRLNINRLNK